MHCRMSTAYVLIFAIIWLILVGATAFPLRYEPLCFLCCTNTYHIAQPTILCLGRNEDIQTGKYAQGIKVFVKASSPVCAFDPASVHDNS
jgi:Trk-type K+ transport system membrane component